MLKKAAGGGSVKELNCGCEIGGAEASDILKLEDSVNVPPKPDQVSGRQILIQRRLGGMKKC